MKFKEYLAFAVIVVSSNPSVGTSPGIKISFFLVFACAEELLSAPNIIFLPNPSPLDNEKAECASNPIPFQNKNTY